MGAGKIVLAAGASGSGKTMITCILLEVLKRYGKKTVSFKCGPDYIDPQFHEQVLHIKSRNLDTFFTGREKTRIVFERNSAGADLAVVEGVMGYYDGIAGISTSASTYDVAGAIDAPVVLIVDCRGMSLSILSFIKGFLTFRADSRIKGVILNRISPMLYPRIKEEIEAQLAVNVLGYVPNLPEMKLESRHLGLILPDEIATLQSSIRTAADVLERTLDINGILDLAGAAAPSEIDYAPQPPDILQPQRRIRIALAQDAAFCFMYQENLQTLEERGAELIPFSPINDQKLPKNISGLLLYGGYPENHAGKLARNQSMLAEIRSALSSGVICMAECGGFLYLHETLEDMQGNPHRMVGTIPGHAYKTDRLSRFGYITLKQGTVFGKKVSDIPAHEFHYFDSDRCGTAFQAEKPKSSRSWPAMHSTDTLFAGFPHLYYRANEQVAEAFMAACYGKERR